MFLVGSDGSSGEGEVQSKRGGQLKLFHLGQLNTNWDVEDDNDDDDDFDDFDDFDDHDFDGANVCDDDTVPNSLSCPLRPSPLCVSTTNLSLNLDIYDIMIEKPSKYYLKWLCRYLE